MSKAIGFVHPDKTHYLEMPDEIYDLFSKYVGLKLIKSTFVDTEQGLRGKNAVMFIIDEPASNGRELQ